MYIHEAIQATTPEKPYITRIAWNTTQLDLIPEFADIGILPTNTPDSCVLYSSRRKDPGPRWNPEAEDLTADDWGPTMIAQYKHPEGGV